MSCDNCKFIDYHTAQRAGMKYWGVCVQGDDFTFMGRNSSCKKFQAADEVTIKKRQEWLAGR